MNRFRSRYGASPLHLTAVLCSFALALYAGVRLLRGDTLGVVLWFVGAALLHDLVLLPLYATADRALQRLLPATGPSGAHPVGDRVVGVNHVRVPAFVSGVLLLVWWPLILGQVDGFTAATALPSDVFLGRWLLVTAALFAVSALCASARLWRRSSRERRRRDATG
ncbi:hypothetical protein [Streptomyces sp. SID1034]|uniref:hypothetical protein n=1 Tax=Streptomyces TaxID=1883 RepID=UPI00136A589A|nr:hypothetical protein [Streptomyces sp. SID1034]